MSRRLQISPEIFAAMQNVDIDALSNMPDSALRCVLPCLVRMSLCAPLDMSDKWTIERKKILKCLSGIEVVNSLVGLLSIDFHALEQDARKEQDLRTKLGGSGNESILISQLENGLALEFERSDAPRKLRLLLSELLFVISQVKEPSTEFYEKSSELFENEVYLEEVCDVLCIAQAELPQLLPITDVAEALLHLPNGIWLMCRLITNVPDSFHDVCHHLVLKGDKQDEDSVGVQRRMEALLALCEMNRGQALSVRALCVENCRLPGLAVALTLYQNKKTEEEESNEETISDVVAFVTGLLLGSDVTTRTWFAHFIRAGQKKKHDVEKSMLFALRQELLHQLGQIIPQGTTTISHDQAVHACAFIRLYCAMKGIAALRLSEEESALLLKLVICRPPATPTGMRFISLGLCMLLACPYLIGVPEQDKQAIEWIKWLLSQVGHFEKMCTEGGSYGEMLLLIAIHFHSNQTHAIADLVSSTLGMKSAVKANSLSRMKAIFTQEIFTEQVVTSHAVHVAVTQQLNANISGFLPVHCIYQLLRSRAFSKHKVPIKEWIYKQILCCKTPVHPLMPPLIEVYITSIILPAAKTDRTNEPISEQEILAVFRGSILSDSSESNGEREEQTGDMVTQMLLVYYVLLYQDTLLSNTKTIVASNRQVDPYSSSLLTQLPMKYLLQTAQKQQQLYAGLFSPLLRLLATHFPHLCLVDDWLDEEVAEMDSAFHTVTASHMVMAAHDIPCTQDMLKEAFSGLPGCSSALVLLLEQLRVAPAAMLLPFTDVFISGLSAVLDPQVPRRVSELMKAVWIKLHTVSPRRLRVVTVNALRTQREGGFTVMAYTEDDITIDPLIVLRCDHRVFRCPPLLAVVLRVLDAFLQASRTYLSAHIQANALPEKPGQGQNTSGPTTVPSQGEREELKGALIAAQESAVIQVLLEACLPQGMEDVGLLSNLREAQCLICSHLHQMFIADPGLAKLVHFQGYASELLPITVAGIPSMHICLDFISELLSQPYLDKQVFAIQLVSYLSIQYALPKSLGVAKLAVSVMTTLLGVLPQETRASFFLPALPALVRICRAFPPMCDETVGLLLQLGRVATSHVANASNVILTDSCTIEELQPLPREGTIKPRTQVDQSKCLHEHRQLLQDVQKTFAEIVGNTALLKKSTAIS